MESTSYDTSVSPSPYQKPKQSFFGKYLFFVLLSIFVCFGVYQLGYDHGKLAATSVQDTISFERSVIKDKRFSKDEINFSLFWRTWDLVKEKYVGAKELDGRKMMYGAIQGMLAATGDNYTTFFDPEQSKAFNDEIRGSFEGIGAEIGLKKGILTIIAPLENSPAQKAGLRAGDKILKIAGEETLNMGVDAAVEKMRGHKGTQVALTVLRSGEDDTREITITRDVIEVKSVAIQYTDTNIAILRVTRFGDDTEREFTRVTREAATKGVAGVILDLRNNPGGYLESAVNMASLMLPRGKTVVMEEDRSGKRKSEYAGSGDILSGVPTIVLINEGSASASEILAGALRENRENVTLVGIKSYGKGSVQELIPLDQGSAVKITVARWLTPKGNQINEKGIEPDVKVELSEDDYNNDRDPQLDKAKELLNQKK